MNKKPRGRQFFHNPGPTNIPDRVLAAMARPTLDFLSDEFLAIHRACHEGLKRILKTRQHLLVYAANGHGAWEAAFANLFSPGERVLVLESGHFSRSWAQMAAELGLEVETLAADWRRGVAMQDLATRLNQDPKGAIRAVLVVHNETATGLVHPIAEVRRILDAARHPAFLFADTISSLASMDFQMDAWGVDCVVGGSQKGLMMATGLSFTGISEKALERSRHPAMRRSYWNWAEMMTRPPQRFPGTTPVHLFYGLEEALRVLEEEGLEAAFARHHRLAAAVRAAVGHWGDGVRNATTISLDGFKGRVTAIENLCADPNRVSDSVTAVLLPDGHGADELIKTALHRFNLSLGRGLGPLSGRAFRIGHLGDLNEPMLLGALSTVELAMRVCSIPHRSGGIDAAIAALSEG